MPDGPLVGLMWAIHMCHMHGSTTIWSPNANDSPNQHITKPWQNTNQTTPTNNWGIPLLQQSSRPHHASCTWHTSCSPSRRNTSNGQSMHPTPQLCSNTPQCHPLLPHQQNDTEHTLRHLLPVWIKSKITHRRIFLPDWWHWKTPHQWSYPCPQQQHAVSLSLHHRSWSRSPLLQCTRWCNVKNHPNWTWAPAINWQHPSKQTMQLLMALSTIA